LRVLRSGFKVQGSGFRVQGSGSRIQGSEFRVLGFRDKDLGLRISKSNAALCHWGGALGCVLSENVGGSHAVQLGGSTQPRGLARTRAAGSQACHHLSRPQP